LTFGELAALRDRASGAIMKSHLCVGAMLFFLAPGTLLAQTAREQAPDRPAESNAAPEESSRDSDSSAIKRCMKSAMALRRLIPLIPPTRNILTEPERRSCRGDRLGGVGCDLGRPAARVAVIKKLDPGLDGKAMEAVRSWKFEAATKDGKPVAVHLQVEVQFRLY
jgi:hypothetical protein